jgi:hypothetical protein
MTEHRLNVVLLSNDKNPDARWYNNRWRISGAVISMDNCNEALRIDSAIILNNYGMAYLSRALAVNNKPTASPLLEAALKFDGFAYEVINKD